jgi:hypothetical protein
MQVSCAYHGLIFLVKPASIDNIGVPCMPFAPPPRCLRKHIKAKKKSLLKRKWVAVLASAVLWTCLEHAPALIHHGKGWNGNAIMFRCSRFVVLCLVPPFLFLSWLGRFRTSFRRLRDECLEKYSMLAKVSYTYGRMLGHVHGLDFLPACRCPTAHAMHPLKFSTNIHAPNKIHST